MVDLKQFREPVECWRDAALPANDVEAERKAEADRLLSIIDSAKVAHEISAPTGRPPRAWTEQEKADCKAALQRIVEMEEADSAGKVEVPRNRTEAASPKQPAAVDRAWETAPPDLYNEISSVLNKHSAESGSNTPDYVLAQFLLESMTAFNAATNRRDAHYNGSAIAGGAK